MTVNEILEMSYPRRVVETIINGLQDPLNQHLIKLVGFEFTPELREHFRQECEAWLDRIQRLRLKPHNRPGTFKFYYNLLFDYQPFSLVQTGDIGANIQSVRFINYGSPFELRVNGTPISLTYEYQPGNTDPDTRLAVVTGDLSAFAGQTVQLKFTTLDMAGSVVNGLDDLQFNAQVAPEPHTTVLLLLGMGLLAFESRRRRIGEKLKH